MRRIASSNSARFAAPASARAAVRSDGDAGTRPSPRPARPILFDALSSPRQSSPRQSVRAGPSHPGTESTRSFFSWRGTNGDAAILLRLNKYINLDHAEAILDRGAAALTPRDEQQQPSRAGLLAVVGYTSCGLDRLIRDARGGAMPELSGDMAMLEAEIGRTIGRLAKTPTPEVRRNVVLDKTQLQAYAPGDTIAFDRLTSVTLRPRQAYVGGNVDLILRPRHGVVSLEPLSAFSHGRGVTGAGEAEGMLDVGARYVVAEVRSGKENGRPSPDPEHLPATTIVLDETA